MNPARTEQREAFDSYWNEDRAGWSPRDIAWFAWQASRAQALEEAAKACDHLTLAIDHAGNAYFRPASAERCAAAIRSIDAGRGMP